MKLLAAIFTIVILSASISYAGCLPNGELFEDGYRDEVVDFSTCSDEELVLLRKRYFETMEIRRDLTMNGANTTTRFEAVATLLRVNISAIDAEMHRRKR